jgi:hypothetical protein
LAFINTIAQVPPWTFQVAVTWPLPVLADRQKRRRPGGPAGALPGCVSYVTVSLLMSVTSLRATPAR